MGIERAGVRGQRRVTSNRIVVGLCVIIALGGLAMAMLVVKLRDELTGATDVARLRGDLSALVTVEGRLESGDRDALDDAEGWLVDLRRDLARASDHFPEMAQGTSFLRAVADAYEHAFDLWRRGIEPSPAIESDLADLARGTDSYLLQTGAATEARAERAFEEGLAMVAGATLLVMVLSTMSVRRLKRTADGLRIAELREQSDRRVRALIEHAPDVVVLVDRANGKISYASPSMTRVLGYGPDDLPELELASILHPEDQRGLNRAFARALVPGSHGVGATARVRHRDGSWRHFEMSLSNPQGDPDLDGIVVNGRDVSERVELERSLSHQASHDPLTGLANRAAFVELLHASLDARAVSDALSVVFLDLDGFKEINDSLGHAAGDEVLMTVAARLVTLTRFRDHVARLGGDEFAIALEGDDAGPLGERLVEVVGQPIELSSGIVHVGASVGIASASEDTTVEDLLRCADVAMYDAKARGKNRVSRFEPHMQEAVMERVALRNALDEALAHHEFRLVYQPEIDLRSGGLLGFEALVRWHRADGTVVAPLDFIPLAEVSGQIVELGRWVLGAALVQLAIWQREFRSPELGMAVNVSARQLEEESFVGVVAEELRRAGVAARTLTLELTETTLIRDIALATQRLGELHDLGVRIAIDDYGSGHASIGYLREFPVDVVKIDGSFVAALDEHPQEAEAYLRSITDLARALEIETVAEGIEHSGQLESLRALGCPIGQGYHLARPLDGATATAYLAQRARQVS